MLMIGLRFGGNGDPRSALVLSDSRDEPITQIAVEIAVPG
jgi:hypothetical protein